MVINENENNESKDETENEKNNENKNGNNEINYENHNGKEENKNRNEIFRDASNNTPTNISIKITTLATTIPSKISKSKKAKSDHFINSKLLTVPLVRGIKGKDTLIE